MTSVDPTEENGVTKPVPNDPQSPTQPGPTPDNEPGKTSPWVEGDSAHDPDAPA